MSKIQLMGSGAFDVYCPTKRVYWRPDTEATVIKVGQPVCYNSDIVKDHKERTVDPTHLGLTKDTYAEGEQEFTGRLFIVEEPLTANLHAWAGIVKSLGPEAGGDGDMIEIWIPTEGAVVPVISDQNCVLDRTIIGIRNGEAATSYPGRPIGVAIETKDRSDTDGFVWMKFKSFEYATINAGGDSASNSLIVDDESAANAVAIDARSVRFDGTGRNRMLYYVGEINGAGHSAYGMFKFRTYVGAALSQNAHAMCVNLIMRDDATLVDTPEFANSALYVTLETETDSLTLSGGSLAAIYIGYYVNEDGAAPARAYALWFNNNNDVDWDGLIHAQAAGDLGDDANSSEPTWSTAHRRIPVEIAGDTFYIHVTAD